MSFRKNLSLPIAIVFILAASPLSSAFSVFHRQCRRATCTIQKQSVSAPHQKPELWSLAMSKVDLDGGTTTSEIVLNSDKQHHPVREGIPKIVSINSREDLMDFLAEDDRLCVVKIYASWCKSCAKFGLKFKHLAQHHGDMYDKKGNLKQNADSLGDVRFAQIEYGSNRLLCKSFGIKKLPFVQLYMGSGIPSSSASANIENADADFVNVGKIDEFVCGPAKFDNLVAKRVDELLHSSRDQMLFEKNMVDGQALTNELSVGIDGVANKDINTNDQVLSQISVSAGKNTTSAIP